MKLWGWCGKMVSFLCGKCQLELVSHAWVTLRRMKKRRNLQKAPDSAAWVLSWVTLVFTMSTSLHGFQDWICAI
uniref:Uncharacterized protein n=1 Tax=Rhizophora mucronata TaxID=61149 RepID=A0A2P2PM87_RHIMU